MAFNKSKYIPFGFVVKFINEMTNFPIIKCRLVIGNIIISDTKEECYEVGIEDIKSTEVVKVSKLDFEKAIRDLMEHTRNKYHKKEGT